jgi:trehalose synthase
MGNLREVHIAHTVRVGAYDRFLRGGEAQLRQLARPLKGTRILHVNATDVGGGVAELLQSQVPFERALGLKSRWYVIEAPERFFTITKQMHNLLQGKSGGLDEASKNFYLETSREIGRALARVAASFRPHIIVIHDPQPLAAASAIAADIPIISRLHEDLLTPNPETLEFIRPFVMKAKSVVMSSRDYVKNFPWLAPKTIRIIYPAIDPLSEKNRPLEDEVAHRVLTEFGVNPTKPLIAQVSRFDPWKDPMGVIQAYYKAKNAVPDLQLVLMGLMLAKDDPQGEEIFARVKKHAKGDPGIFLFADPRIAARLSDSLLVNAVYTASDVIIQKSIREGFGLTMTEAMWKGKAVVAGRTTGALIQIRNGKNGLLVSSPEEAAKVIVRLLRRPALRAKLGRAARASVLRRFLMPRFVADNLAAYRSLAGARRTLRARKAASTRTPRPTRGRPTARRSRRP